MAVLEGEGRGPGPARNLGAEHAEGECLAFVDADTEVRANYLTEMLRYVEREGKAATSDR